MNPKKLRVSDDLAGKIILYSGLLFVLTLFIWQVGYYWHYTNDDAYITLRYSRFMALGRGPYYNIGEHVEGYTNFSLMLLLSLVIKLFGAQWGPLAAKLIGTGWGVLAIVFTVLFVNFILSKYYKGVYAALFGVFSGGIIAVSPAFALNSTSGLETTMFACFLISGVGVATMETSVNRWYGSGLLFAGANLTRPEGSLLFAVFWLSQFGLGIFAERGRIQISVSELKRLLQTKRIRILGVNLIIVITIFMVHMAFRYIMYDGELLPNTYYAKLGGFWQISALTYIRKGILPSLLGLFGVGVAWVGYLFQKDIAQEILPVGVIALTGALMPLLTGTDWMLGWRLTAPYLPLAVSVTVMGWCAVCHRLLTQRAVIVAAMILAVSFIIGYRQQNERLSFWKQSRLRAIGYQTGHQALAHYLLKDRIAPGEAIALMDIGIIGYICIDQKVLDITGLTDRLIAKSPGGFLNKAYNPDYVLDQKPRIIVLVLWAPGRSYQRPDKNLKFKFWTGIGDELYHTPFFQQHYLSGQRPNATPGDWYTELARKMGAAKIFEHGHPAGIHYVLAVFRYHP